MGKFSLNPKKIPPKATGPDEECEGNGEMASAGYPDADEPKADYAVAPAPEAEEYDCEMPVRFHTGGADAAEIAAWKAEHGKKPGKYEKDK